MAGLGQLRASKRRALLGAAGAAVFLILLASLDTMTRGAVSLPAMVPPFGASVAIVFFTPESPLGKPWNVLGGHLVSALVASLVIVSLPEAPANVLIASAVPAAVLGMLVTRSFHPPGGATALLATLAHPRLGFGMLLCPVLFGAGLLVAVRFALDIAVTRWCALSRSAQGDVQ